LAHTAFLLLASAWCGMLGPIPNSTEAVRRTVAVMGTWLRGEVAAPCAPAAVAALEAALAEVERVDALLSTWGPSTPLSRANRAPVGTPVPLPAEAAALLAEVGAWSGRTGGAFEPTVGALVDAWDLRGLGRIPTPDALAAARGRVGPAALVVDPAAATLTRLREGAWVDTGGFGKGAALRSAADTLRARGASRAFLDLGGQVLALAASGEEPWRVAVAHPSHRQDTTAILLLRDASAATSGNSEQGLWVAGREVGHILDPRSGEPAPWWGSVTVVSADPLEADILSTALYVMGPEAGMAWARDLPDVGVLFLVEADGELLQLHNQAMDSWLVEPPASAGTCETSSPERRHP